MPGNKCIGGLDLNPIVYSCSAVSFLSLHTLGYLIIIVAILYFGWPLIEAIVIALPIPDPKDLKDKLKSYFSKSTATSRGRSGAASKKDYTKNFTQPPESLGESSDEEDSINNRNNGSAKHLKYESDEDKDELKGDELISLDGASTGPSTTSNSKRDRTATAADQVPKLSRP